jgi:F420-dependent methylenetetrahydromethanopterin dehydrogenase
LNNIESQIITTKAEIMARTMATGKEEEMAEVFVDSQKKIQAQDFSNNFWFFVL